MSARPRGPQPSGPRAPGPREKTCCWSASSWLHLLRSWSLRSTRGGSLEAVFTSLVGLRAGGLVIGEEPFFNSRAGQLGALALRHAVPTIYQLREFAAGGGVASYGPNLSDAYYLMGSYTGRVLNGAKPADLPVQQSTKVELIINMKAAKALGISVPLPLSGRADELIE